MLECMKKLPAFMMVMALLVMSFANIAHADCAEGMICDGVEQTLSADQHNDHDGDQKQAACDCCATCSEHHHHSHMAALNGKAEPIMASSQTAHSSEGATYLSQLHYPPSKPPKA